MREKLMPSNNDDEKIKNTSQAKRQKDKSNCKSTRSMSCRVNRTDLTSDSWTSKKQRSFILLSSSRLGSERTWINVQRVLEWRTITIFDDQKGIKQEKKSRSHHHTLGCLLKEAWDASSSQESLLKLIKKWCREKRDPKIKRGIIKVDLMSFKKRISDTSDYFLTLIEVSKGPLIHHFLLQFKSLLVPFKRETCLDLLLLNNLWSVRTRKNKILFCSSVALNKKL